MPSPEEQGVQLDPRFEGLGVLFYFTLKQGVLLLEDRKYKEASDLFRKLTDEFPKDARVWYYAALSNGLATNQWRGETERLVNQGVECEKAGSPEAPEIDAVMTDLAPSSKRWLDFYRQRAR